MAVAVAPTSDPLELRLMRDQDIANEDAAIYALEVYVRYSCEAPISLEERGVARSGSSRRSSVAERGHQMLPSREKVLESAARLGEELVAVEAFWDGDTEGWFLVVAAVLRDGKSVDLCVLSEGGDIRVFNGQVPPWPEAQFAKLVGDEIAAKLGVPFWFPSPDHPEDDCARFADRGRSYPCSMCGIPLLQRDPCPWKGTCYQCHLRAQKR